MATKETPQATTGNDAAVIAALLQITGYDVCRVQTGVREKDNSAIMEDGYLLLPNGQEYAFKNEIGQSCHVPAHRVKELIDPAPAPVVAEEAKSAKNAK